MLLHSGMSVVNKNILYIPKHLGVKLLHGLAPKKQ